MAPQKRWWDCHGKDCKGQPCGYRVPAGCIACNACGHQPPAHISGAGAATTPGRRDRKQGADANKGAKGRGKGCGKPEVPLTTGASAEKQLKKEKHELQLQVDKLTKESKQLKAASAGGPLPGTAVDSDSMDQDPGDASATTLAAAITQARDELRQLQDCTEFYKSLIPDFGTALAAAQRKLEEATAARRAANPLKVQLEGAEGYQTRMAKKLADAKAGLAAKHQQLAEAQAALERQQAAVAEAEATAAKADAEVAVLAARFASERNAPPAQATNAVPPARPAEQAPPAAGYVTIAFAEEKWAEREALYQQQMAQLQSLVAAQADEDTASEAGESDIGQVIGDEVWNKVEKGKRKTLLRKEKEALATKVRAGIGKVSMASSPFKKT
jgi:DNA repair exonuclease SbcCD ATPase subunit